MAALTAPNPYAFGIGMPQPERKAPIQTGVDLSVFGAPAVDPAAAAAGRSMLAAPAVTPTASATATRPQSSALAAPASAAFGGIQAGQLGSQAYDTKSGIAATLGAAATGAATGAVVGGPVGAVVGGVAGLATGGLNAWLSVGSQNKAKREQRDLLRQAKAEQKRRDDVLRADAVEQLGYDRREAEKIRRAEQWNKMKVLLADTRAKINARKASVIEKGYA